MGTNKQSIHSGPLPGGGNVHSGGVTYVSQTRGEPLRARRSGPRALSMSARGYRRCPPRVMVDPIFPASAQRATVVGPTCNCRGCDVQENCGFFGGQEFEGRGFGCRSRILCLGDSGWRGRLRFHDRWLPTSCVEIVMSISLCRALLYLGAFLLGPELSEPSPRQSDSEAMCRMRRCR